LTLQENIGSDRSWVWTCPADYADEEAKQEVFAIRFANSESNINGDLLH
jgi:Ran-binding protein 1